MHFDKPTYTVRKTKKKGGIPKGLYTKDPATGEIVFNKELVDNQMVMPNSGYHFPIGARERITALVDADSFTETGAGLRSADPLNFTDSQPYKQRLKRYEKDSGLPEAVICGTGKIHGIDVALAVMDFRFCGGHRFVGKVHAVRSHIGNQSGLVQTLRHHHGYSNREVQLTSRFLL